MATIRDVAKRAGVAPITVSRVLNNSGYVSPETRLRVESAAAELNYVPNMLARSLRSSETRTLALVLTDITNPFWTTVARGVEDVASRYGYTVLFCNTDESDDKEQVYLTMLLRRRVDGVILVPANPTHTSVEQLRSQGVHVVVMDRRIPGIAVDLVMGDSLEGARMAVDYLLESGHRHIAALMGPAHLSVSQERAAGYRMAHDRRDLPVDEAYLRFGSYTVESGCAMTEAVLALTPTPTAIFAGNNFIAMGVLHCLRDRGLSAPDDLSVISFDDLPSEYLLDPFLTVVSQPAYEMGCRAAELLLRRLSDEASREPEELVMPTELIVRRSVRALSPRPV